MNKDQKAAVIDGVAEEIEQSEAIVAVDYRGLSVKQAAELRNALSSAGASFRIVKNTLTERAADKAGAESLKQLLEGPTALTFVRGDVALAAKALATFRRETGALAFKGGRLGDDPLEIDQIEALARLPGRDALNAQFVGVLASPVTTLVRGLNSLVAGLAVALSQIEQQGLLAPGASEESSAEPASTGEPEPAAQSERQPAADAGESEAAGEPAAEAEHAAEAEPAAGAEPAAEAEPAAGAEPAAEAEPAAGAEPAAEAEPAAGAEPAAEAEPAADAERQVEAAAEAGRAAEAESEVQSEPSTSNADAAGGGDEPEAAAEGGSPGEDAEPAAANEKAENANAPSAGETESEEG